MAVLTGGTALAQLISFASSPILSRLYTEQEYGSYGIFTSIVSYFVVASCLRLDQAVVLPKDDYEAKSIAQWAVRLIFIASSISLVASVIGVLYFHFSIYFLLIAPTVFFMGLINVYNLYSTREKMFKYNSVAKLITGIILVVTSVFLGYLQYGVWGLVGGLFLGQIVGGTYLHIVLKNYIWQVKNTLSWKDIRSKYKQFLFINTPHALFDLTESAGVVLILGLFYDKEYIGAYFFAIRILKTPLGIIGSAIFQVFFKESADIKNSGESFLSLFLSLRNKILLFSFLPFLILYFFGEEIFIYGFGENWLKSGYYASIFAPWLWLNFAASSLSSVPVLLNKQGQAFVIATINTIVKLLTILIAGLYFTFEIFVILFSINQTIMMIFNNSWYTYLVKKYG